ncbi:hypothetical protein V2J09_004297 [Rumex salicifolius]
MAVHTLAEIANELGKKDWNFEVNPCSSANTSWRTPSNPQTKTYANQLDCDHCSRGQCHVVNISLPGQDLAGVLPKSLANLPYLKNVNFMRNYLSGTIPLEWASMSLESLIISVNRLSGEIPKELGNITTLTILGLENNFFSGVIPAELGKLVNLSRLTLSANYFTGKLPKELMNLSNLNEMISSNNFSGQIPDYFPNWRKLQMLEIQSSGFLGPIPSSISSLSNLTELKISDLMGRGSKFPPLANMEHLKWLMLRNCNISGSIPGYLANLPNLVYLDLSFNNFEGPIPDDLQKMTLQYLYLTSNFLTGPIPDWIKNIGGNTQIDLSYNNFEESSVPSSCNAGNVTLAVCLRNTPCTEVRYSLHINCGGGETSIGKTTYDADYTAGGPAKFSPAKAEWGFSSTGNFWYNDPFKNYIATNDSILHLNNSDLYTNARVSAISLTYYGRCLAKGEYTITLHFAEIVFRDNFSFYSLGKRIFNVYVQEKLVLEDFDIVKAANGTEKAFSATFNHISVLDTGTIEIRFYYAGKGTTAAPQRGIYGPLVSAISVESEFSPPHDQKKLTKIVVLSVALLIGLFLISSIIYWRLRQQSRPSREEILRGLDLQSGMFNFTQIEVATNSFDIANMIGKGGSGTVYKGTLLDGTYIAVKRLSSKSLDGNKQFVTEIGLLSSLYHPNLVRLYGCCVEGSELLLVYEYMVNNNLAQALFEDAPLGLDWPTRLKICVGIAKGLAFLHEESTLKIIHRDIKPTNILLDSELNAKISDFGLARLDEEGNTHICTKLAGTVGYTAPEYALWGYLTFKADVYSFGIVALEVVAGRSNMNFRPDENHFCLLDWAFYLQQKGNLMEIVDPKIEGEYNKEEALRVIRVALLCGNASPGLRPTMSQVLSMLQPQSTSFVHNSSATAAGAAIPDTEWNVRCTRQ